MAKKYGMTKRHYEMMADIVKTVSDEYSDETLAHRKILVNDVLSDIVSKFAAKAKEDNELFNEEKFRKACNLL